MTTLYTAITERIRQYLPNVQWIDFWNNQLINTEQEHPFPRPAVFIEFLPIRWKREARQRKAGDISIRVHVVQDMYADTFDGASSQTEGLAVWQFAMEADDALENFAPAGFSSLQGETTEPDINHGNLIDIVHTYTTTGSFVIVPPNRTEVEVNAGLKVTGEILP